MAALEKYPDIEVVAETFTGWDVSTGAQQALDLITTHRFGLKDTDAAIKAVGASEGVIHVSLLPWE